MEDGRRVGSGRADARRRWPARRGRWRVRWCHLRDRRRGLLSRVGRRLVGAGTVALGCLLVAVVAQLIGTGFGLLLRNPVLACAATIVVPLGLWLILGLGFLKAAQPWLTPFPSVQRLLSGDMSGLAWPQWTVMALMWAGGLNVLGATRLRR